MPAFKALNIESDDESDIQVDDTKELQTEEALKLYQTALRYHAEGPDSYAKASEAYSELFRSEIFRYPESQTELRRIELYGPLPEVFETAQDVDVGVPTSAAAYAESGPSTLPHILHLSHKNFAQFKLDKLAASLDFLDVQLRQIVADATSALDHFVEALDKDDTDLDLWRRTAIVGGVLHSGRVARFCLESVLDGDDEGIDNVLSLPGLEEALAGQQLRELVETFSDRLSFLQAPLSTSKRKVLSKFLKQRLGPYDDIIQREQVLKTRESPPQTRQSERMVLKAPHTWTELGDLILQQHALEQQTTMAISPNNAIAFDDRHFKTPNIAAVTEQSVRPCVEASQRRFKIPVNIAEQFPGLDGGQPTVRMPYGSFGHPSVTTSAVLTKEPPQSINLPSRKRSGEAAGIPDGTDEGRSKSRRTRARDSTLDTQENRHAPADINKQWEYDQQLNEVQAVDDWVYETAGSLFEKIGVIGFQQVKGVRQDLDASRNISAETGLGEGLGQATCDLYAFLEQYSDQLARLLLIGGVDFELGHKPSHRGANAAVGSGASKISSSRTQMPNSVLPGLIAKINEGWFQTQQVAHAYVKALVRPGSSTSSSCLSGYRRYQWPESLKTMIVRVLVSFDEAIYRSTVRAFEGEVRESSLDTADDLAEEIQTIFELHLDVYCLIKQANSGVDQDTIATQGDRLRRWADLAQYTTRHRRLASNMQDATHSEDELLLRFLWATAFHTGTDADVTQDHFIRCLEDLRALFVGAGEPIIELQNNAIMPELSVKAIDQETSRLTTKDFFFQVTDQDPRDPVAMIEALQPLLDTLESSERTAEHDADDMDVETKVPEELVRFVRNSGVNVRLLLWQRLRDAYTAIDYKPMVISCYFSMLKVLLAELRSPAFHSLTQYDRQALVLNTMNTVKDMVTQILNIIGNHDDALHCLDFEGLISAVTSLALVLRLTQVFNVYEDSLRIGQTQPPLTPNGAPLPTFQAVRQVMQELQLHVWMVLYALLGEAIAQNRDQFPSPAEDRFDLLRSLHRNLGIRGICGGLNLTFVRMLWKEFLQLSHVEGCESEQAQVLYDLFGLNCFLNPSYELIEHQCVHVPIERSVCVESVDLLLAQASKLPIKELIKHPLKDAIDKVHGIVNRKKPTDAIIRNREIYRSFMRSPIHPMDMYQCLKGEGSQLPVSSVPVKDAWLASKGWYFLMGHVNLAKFRSQKRTGPTPTEDVDIAIAFFHQELEFSMESWETWFRLAQAYDTKIEESVVWSAEKLNNNMSEVVQLQRAAIHCYIVATALANRQDDLAPGTLEKMNEMYSDFATRLYSTSRQPFGMLPFGLDDTIKFFSLSNQHMKQAKPFEPLKLYTAWKLARALYRRALAGQPQSWTLHLMLGKCQWKMHDAPEMVRPAGRHSPPAAQEVIDCFVQAVELLPGKKDSRDTKREPVLEPHYKLVSIIHKMVTRGRIGLEEARQALEHTQYARNVDFAQDTGSDWARYVLAVLKNLRTADKSNWHHRMIARAADIRYAQNGVDADTRAAGAKQELTQQMFTKTMVLQVWRPEGERAGRHFVYTARYTRFFVRILEQLHDRINLEQLGRRVRRRPNEIFEHSSVWQDIATTYLRLLRNFAGVPISEGLETATFSAIPHEDFLARKEPLERWMQATEVGESAALDILREANELKKVNANLAKTGLIDDLIGDSYAWLFANMGKQLLDDERARQPPAPTSPPRNPTMSLTHLMNTDGASDAPSSAVPVSEQPVPRKKIGVGRREIRTTAEASALRAAPTAQQLKGHQNVRVQVVINNSRSSHNGDASADTSAPASVHDDADDESELSELEEEGDDADMEDVKDEEEEKRPMFPNLAGESESPTSFETADEAMPDAEGMEQSAEGSAAAQSAMREVQDSQE